MNHLPFIAASYALGVAIPAAFALAAAWRMRTAQRRLAAIDPRAARRRAAEGAAREAAR